MVMGCAPFDDEEEILDCEYGEFYEDIEESSMEIFFNLVQFDCEKRFY